MRSQAIEDRDLRVHRCFVVQIKRTEYFFAFLFDLTQSASQLKFLSSSLGLMECTTSPTDFAMLSYIKDAVDLAMGKLRHSAE